MIGAEKKKMVVEMTHRVVVLVAAMAVLSAVRVRAECDSDSTTINGMLLLFVVVWLVVCLIFLLFFVVVVVVVFALFCFLLFCFCF